MSSLTPPGASSPPFSPASGEPSGAGAAPETRPSDRNLLQRLATSLLLLPFVMAAVWVGGWPFLLMVVGGGLVGLLEFYHFAHHRPEQGAAVIGVPAMAVLCLGFFLNLPALILGALAFALVGAFVLQFARHPDQFSRAARQTAMTMAGLVYVALPCGFLLALRGWPLGLIWLLVILALTWGTDTFAYLGGRLWGRTPLAPVLSPKKTVEGAIVGYFSGLTPALIVLGLNNLLSPAAILLCALGPLVAIAGDLFESALKRSFSVKDSHVEGLNILPGHGGVLDRVDALLFVTSFVYLGVSLLGLPVG